MKKKTTPLITWLHKHAHPITNTLLKRLLFVIQQSVCLGESQHLEWAILFHFSLGKMLQIYQIARDRPLQVIPQTSIGFLSGL